MTVGLSAANLANQWLNMLGGTAFTAPAAFYVKLHTADPGASGATAASAETTRKAVTFSAASAGSKSMSGTVSWTSWSAGSETISHVSFWDASTAGNFLGSAALTASKSVANGDTLTLSTLTVALTPIAA
jgi:hypothetical protein